MKLWRPLNRCRCSNEQDPVEWKDVKILIIAMGGTWAKVVHGSECISLQSRREHTRENVPIVGSMGVLDIQIGCAVLCCNIRKVKIAVTHFKRHIL
jgi:hypothetical protein